ncbi:MAG: hypothetical protein IKF72_13630 [Kiritimatiellae bacterium]|nr:hypothetical protein [Kiritimatiellia bacterium]
MAREIERCNRRASRHPELSGYDLVAIFPVGYADPAAKPAPLHALRKRVSEILREL